MSGLVSQGLHVCRFRSLSYTGITKSKCSWSPKETFTRGMNDVLITLRCSKIGSCCEMWICTAIMIDKFKTWSQIWSILKKSKHNSSRGGFFRKARGGKKLKKKVVMFYCVRYSMILTAICFGSQPQQVRQGTIPILRHHIFGLFLTHRTQSPYVSMNKTERQQNCHLFTLPTRTTTHQVPLLTYMI